MTAFENLTMHYTLKRCLEASAASAFTPDTPRKRQKLNPDAHEQETSVFGVAQQLGVEETTTMTTCDDGDGAAAHPWAVKSPEWSFMLKISPTAVGSPPSDDVASPHTPHAVESHDAQDIDLFSPLDNIISPATDYSEGLPFATGLDPTTRKLIQHFFDAVAPLLLFDVTRPRGQIRELLVPLAHDNDSALTAAMCAVSSAHLERTNSAAGLGVTAADFHSRALSSLATLIESGREPDVTLATIILLVAFELSGSGRSPDMIEHHLRGAHSILIGLRGARSDLFKLLENQFRFYNVIVALSLGTDPVGQVPALGSTSSNILHERRSTSASPNINADLWPVLHRLATLPGIKQELAEAVTRRQTSWAAVLRGEVSTSSLAIEAAFTAWIELLAEQENLSYDAHFILAYSYTGLVYLYRNVLGYPQRHQLVQVNAYSALTHYNAIVTSGSPQIGMLWPLFTSSCEAVGQGRVLAREIFNSRGELPDPSPVDQVWSVVEEMWKQVDQNATKGVRAEDTFTAWRRIEKSKGLRLILS